jgi:hypothetical protein
MNWKNCLLTFICGVVILPAAFGQSSPAACTHSSAAGTYSVSCSGWVSVGGSFVPIRQLGIATGDATGSWTGVTTINIAGQSIVPKATVSGQATLDPDCTGSITYNKGTAGEINLNFVVNAATNEILGIATDKGTVMSCELKRMSSSNGR